MVVIPASPIHFVERLALSLTPFSLLAALLLKSMELNLEAT
ncbi:hypothetical protein SAMN02745132_04485, partial [Enterovibrio nigricans DSM 22720]